MLEKNVVLVKKGAAGKLEKVPIVSQDDNIALSASMSDQDFNLSSYGVPQSICDTMDRAVQVSVAAGLEALRDAGIVSGEGEGTQGWVLPEHLQPTTGIVYATSFPALDTAITEVTKFFRTRDVDRLGPAALVEKLRRKFAEKVSESEVSSDVEYAFCQLEEAFAQLASSSTSDSSGDGDGPEWSTQAIAIAHDMIQIGRAERMIVIAGDNASSDALMPWLGNGFRALGAATICPRIKDAARPFDAMRSGMILGSGGIGMVLESEEGARRRHVTALKYGQAHAIKRPAFKCRLLGSLYTNSAYHGAALDREHIAEEMERFIASAEREHSIHRSEIAKYGVYFSHETSTNASPTASCASNELYGLRKVFGEDFKNLLILNTKGFTGHPMGVSFEDVVAVEVLSTGRVPAIANLEHIDPHLGNNVRLSPGGMYPCRYALRFAAGFGSQIAMALYGGVDT
ncbi:sch1 [Symbiodinium microadriaticum]|nr:sch1 [Symbiodinium microadriaticum]